MRPSRPSREWLLSLPLVTYWALLFLASWLTHPESGKDALLVPMLVFGGLPIFIIAARTIVHGPAEASSDLAETDYLSGAANRRAFTRDLHEALKWTRPGSVGLLLFDVQGLKHVNDTCGHQAGDELLILVGHRFGNSGGKLYRTAGDEFAILVRRSEGGAVTAVARLLDEPYLAVFETCGHLHEVRVAYGMTSNHSGDSFEQLFRRADDQLLLHKQALRRGGELQERRLGGSEPGASLEPDASDRQPPRNLRLLG